MHINTDNIINDRHGRRVEAGAHGGQGGQPLRREADHVLP